jgi:cell division protein FtsB
MNTQQKLERCTTYIKQTKQYQELGAYRQVSAEEIKRLEAERNLIETIVRRQQAIQVVFNEAKKRVAERKAAG